MIMKKIIFFLLLLSKVSAFSQVTADPALSPIKITSKLNVITNELQLPLNDIVKLKIPIYNLNLGNQLPSGTCKIKIGLGSKMLLSPTFDLSTVNTSNYFHWTALSSGGQVQITGELIAELPPNFSDTASFDLFGSILGGSTITTNFLVTNHNTPITLSDENGNNNTSSLFYFVVPAVVPVTFTAIRATKKECSIKVDFNIENEINVTRYEIEISADLNNFEKIGLLQATNANSYTYIFNVPEKHQVPTCLVRIKAIDFDGKFQYSEIRKLSAVCNTKSTVFLYPNPVPRNIRSVYIEKDNGAFNGTYTVSLFDFTGKQVQENVISLLNATRFNYDIQGIAIGQYFIKIIKNGTEDLEVLKVIKL